MLALRRASSLATTAVSATPVRVKLKGGVSITHAAFDVDLAGLPASSRWLRSPDAFVVAGEKVSVFSLDDRPVEKQQSDSRRQRDKMSVPVAPLRLRAHGGAKVRARLTGVAALPRSRLFAVTDEDGKVRVCR